jgi:hypothetical protein
MPQANMPWVKERQLHNVYLGKTETLTQARLEEGCRALTERARKQKEANQSDSMTCPRFLGVSYSSLS